MSYSKSGVCWTAPWRVETTRIMKEVTVVVGESWMHDMTRKRFNIVMELYNERLEKAAMEKVNKQSLRWLPTYHKDRRPQEYLQIENEEVRQALTKFRLGNAGMGNREGARVNTCPACGNRANNESHLIFKCEAPEIRKVRDEPTIKDLMLDFHEKYPSINNQDEALKTFLKGENRDLEKRGNLLVKMLKSFKEHYHKGN